MGLKKTMFVFIDMIVFKVIYKSSVVKGGEQKKQNKLKVQNSDYYEFLNDI